MGPIVGGPAGGQGSGCRKGQDDHRGGSTDEQARERRDGREDQEDQALGQPWQEGGLARAGCGERRTASSLPDG